MRKKTVIILLLVLVVAVAVIYGWNEYTRTKESLVNRRPDYTVNAGDLITEFERSDTASEKKYLGKMLLVNGTISRIEKDDRNDFTIVLGESGSMSGVRCSMDTVFRAEAAKLKEGQPAAIKGIFTGFQKDETGLLGSDILLNRSVISKDNN